MPEWALPPGSRAKRNTPTNICAFCRRKLKKARPRDDAFSADDPSGGVCSCGAGWVIDPTGKNGGMSWLDALSVACGGDVSQAMTMKADVDYEVKNTVFKGVRIMRGANPPRVWFARLVVAATNESD
jgi:hypothetical protein